MSEWKECILQDVVSKLGDGLHGTHEYCDNGEYYFINGNNLILDEFELIYRLRKSFND